MSRKIAINGFGRIGCCIVRALEERKVIVDEIKASVKERKGAVQSPKEVLFVDALPLTAEFVVAQFVPFIVGAHQRHVQRRRYRPARRLWRASPVDGDRLRRRARS